MATVAPCFDGGLWQLLKSLRLKKYWPLFEKRFASDLAFEINDASLKDLGLPLGARKKLLVRLTQLQTVEEENADVAVAPTRQTTRIRRIVKDTSTAVAEAPPRKRGVKQIRAEALLASFRIERIKPAAFDRVLEMQTIDALYFSKP